MHSQQKKVSKKRKSHTEGEMLKNLNLVPINLPDDANRGIRLNLGAEMERASELDGVSYVELSCELWGDIRANTLVYNQVTAAGHRPVIVPRCHRIRSRVFQRRL